MDLVGSDFEGTPLMSVWLARYEPRNHPFGEEAMGAIAELMLCENDKRVSAVLAGGRPQASAGKPPIEIDASREDLAGLVNVARITAGSILRRLQAQRLFEIRYGKVIVLNLTGSAACVQVDRACQIDEAVIPCLTGAAARTAAFVGL